MVCTSQSSGSSMKVNYLCIVFIAVFALTSANPMRIPAESAAGRAKYFNPLCRYPSSLVQRSVSPPIPAVSGNLLEKMMSDEENLENPGKLGNSQFGAPGSQGGNWLGLGKRVQGDHNHIDDDDAIGDDDDDTSSRFTPYVSVGVLSNLQQFFDSLRDNLDSLEELPAEEKDLLLGRAINGETSKHSSPSTVPDATQRRRTEHRGSRPAGTAAYLHALRSHQPSHKIRNFVANAEPAELRGSNMYNPAWLWTGLGRRRR